MHWKYHACLLYTSLAEYEELIRRLYEAISSLPPMQARRVHARYMPVSYTHLDVYKRQMLPHMMEAAGVTEELKACDPMRWVGLMNALTAQIEEILIRELICRCMGGAGNADLLKGFESISVISG